MLSRPAGHTATPFQRRFTGRIPDTRGGIRAFSGRRRHGQDGQCHFRKRVEGDGWPLIGRGVATDAVVASDGAGRGACPFLRHLLRADHPGLRIPVVGARGRGARLCFPSVWFIRPLPQKEPPRERVGHLLARRLAGLHFDRLISGWLRGVRHLTGSRASAPGEMSCVDGAGSTGCA